MKAIITGFLILIINQVAFAKMENQITNEDVALLPLLMQSQSTSKIMIAMGYDHQLFVKAYSDYSDLNNDRKLDVTYQDEIEYVGYFQSDYCYVYTKNSQIEYFKANSKVVGDTHKCTDFNNDFSGNFLNWVSMTRMDIIRLVLFGGKRLIDDIDQTILTRAFLTQDTHSFSKTFKRESGAYLPNNDSFSGINEQYISFCNTSVLGTPVLMAANGKFSQWATNEKIQCVYDQNYFTPDPKDYFNQWQLNVLVCDELTASSQLCFKYKNGHFKPIGMLQEYSQKLDVEFGLISGSQINPHSGGVLRKNVQKLTNNINPQQDEINLETGQFNAVDGIISNISSMRMVGLKKSMHQTCNDYFISKKRFLKTDSIPKNTTINSSCSDWGNPIGEIYLEALRYMSGQTNATDQYSSSQYKESDFIEGLSVESQWKYSIDENSECDHCAILVISAGQNSFDHDDLENSGEVLPALGNLTDLNTLIDQIGIAQFEVPLNEGGLVLYGENGFCELSQLKQLSIINSVCNSLAYLEGGYAISGLSYFAATQDINPKVSGAQSLSTYVLQLSENIPKFSVDITQNSTIEIIPICQAKLHSNSQYSPCSLINIDVIKKNQSKGLTDQLIVRFYWADSLWGADYDLDTTQEIHICVGPINCNNPSLKNNELQIKNSMQRFSNNDVRVTYQVLGSKNDGINENWIIHSGENFNENNPNDDPNTAPKNKLEFENTKKYQIGNSAFITLPTPLWLAAKFGGFDDINNNGIIQLQSQWDKRNNLTGVVESDGVPDHYFTGFNPAMIRAQLKVMFEDISKQKFSTSQVSLQNDPLSNTSIAYQTSYFQTKQNNAQTVSWVGDVQAFFVDDTGRIREDSDLNNQLTLDDNVIQSINMDGAQYFQRYQLLNDELILNEALQSIETIKPIWSASDFLNKSTVYFDAYNQREYEDNTNKRYIFTAIDNKKIDFIDNKILKSQSHFFALNEDDLNFSDLISYIRGVEIKGTRNRTLQVDGVQTIFRLGDIGQSSSALLSAPNNLIYEKTDSSYSDFKQKYQSRRNVILVGANDGMLHAFNAGFWNREATKVDLSNQDELAVKYELGAELWAFIPQAALPHLKWLSKPNYKHSYYVDGNVKLFDVKIFSDDDTHPNGWGTIAVASMGSGGYKQIIDHQGKQTYLNSSYFILDVTNPEQPPTVLAQISDADLGFTQAKAELVISKNPLTNERQWNLVLASGVTDLKNYQSDQSGKLAVFNLNSLTLLKYDTGVKNSYLTDFTKVDYDQDAIVDWLYFGLNQSINNKVEGRIWRFDLKTHQFSEFIDVKKSISSAPLFIEDSQNNFWLLFGTGRYQTQSDILFDSNDFENNQQYFVAVKEPINKVGAPSFESVKMDQLFDTTGIQHFQSGKIKDHQNLPVFDFDGNTLSDSFALQQYIQTLSGWKIRLDNSQDSGVGLNLNQATQYNQLIMFSEYVASQNSCDATGLSKLHYINFKTGIADELIHIDDVVVINATNVINSEELANNDDKVIKNTIGYLDGLSNSPLLNYTDQSTQVLLNGSNGSLNSRRLNVNLSEPKRIGWRQLY
ncbi:pilus assembly protein [Marinicellulosiphila megalodicopiae]|uniref:pilus assembly protein n=1 Tax=Marinicellulosiphila megalodicopiae TaxID=2724896 RepID=UPI003BB15E13